VEEDDMARASRWAALTVAAVAGLVAVRRAQATSRREQRRMPEWVGVTVLASPERIAPGGELPAPLRGFGEEIEVRMRQAPGGRGTELYARPVNAAPPAGPAGRLSGTDDRGPLRKALREAKSLVECGEVVLSDAASTTHPGPGGKLVAALDRRAEEAGRL
jgi:hypothetical protein